MRLYKTDRNKWIAGLIMILLLYSVYYIYFADRQYTYYIPRKIRHIIKFTTTVAVYFTGSLHLGKLTDKWMGQLWHIIHISLLITITLIGIYDWTFGMVSNGVKELAATMQEFLISPLLYVAMGIINKRLVEKKSPV